jgi:hypothetical protein
MRTLTAAVLAVIVAALLTASLPAQPPNGKKAAVPKLVVKDPATAAFAAREDLLKVAPQDRPYTRYLTIYPVAKDKRENYIRILNFWMNSLSRNPQIVLATRVPGTDDTMLRIDMRDYYWDPKAWDKLVEGDTYFLARLVRTRKVVQQAEEVYEEPIYEVRKTQVLVPNGKGTYRYETKEERVQTGTRKVTRVKEGAAKDEQERVMAAGPWIEPAVSADLIAMSQSTYPIMHGLVFFAETNQDDVYKKFLAVGDKEKDFQKLVDGDPDVVAKLYSDRQGTVSFSGVTLRNRRLTRLPTRVGVRGGYYWFTTDTRKDAAKQNYLEILLDRGPENFDATEQIASLPNGLQAYALFNNQGDRQTEAPPDIAGDKSSTNNDLRVRNPLSCVRCHVEGIIPFKSVYPRLRKTIKIEAYLKEDLQRLDQLYGADLADVFEFDQAIYAKAVKKATNMTPLEVAKLHAQVYHEWDESPVNLATVAADLGVTPEVARKVLEKSERASLLVLLDKEDPEAITRAQWRALFPEAAVLLFNSRVADAEKRVPMPIIEPPVVRPRIKDFDKAFPPHDAAEPKVKEDKK